MDGLRQRSVRCRCRKPMGVVPLPIYKVGGQLKNYLRCHHCVKAGEKMLITARKLDFACFTSEGC
jgi:hypothetical protein